jgi:hypothetical protein
MKKYQGPWTETQLRHLLRRSLFGVTMDDYDSFKEKSMDQCLDLLLNTTNNSIPPLYYMDLKTMTIKEYKWETYITYMIGRVGLTSSCILPMIYQQRNVGERMVLFWHNHFATQFNNTKSGGYTWQYFVLLRKYVTGNFKILLREITTNPQMLIFLNGNLNNKTAPNENYARELQELFSIGKGPASHYTESDVHAAARVLTGWKINDDKQVSYFDADIHDIGDKTFSAFYGNHVIKGRSGADGAQETDALIDMICAQPETAKYICRKLYRWFVNSNINDVVETEIITPLAEILVKSDYEVKPVLQAILNADFFYDPGQIGGIIKSPLDFLVGMTREFDLKNDLMADTREEAFFVLPFTIDCYTTDMGQEVCNPPSVAGWRAYYEYPLYDREWLSSAIFGHMTWVNYVTSLDRTDPEATLHLDLIAYIRRLGTPADSRKWLTEAINQLYTMPPGSGQVAFLQNLLDTGPNYHEKWNTLWSLYEANKNDSDLLMEVRTRLKNTFLNLLTYPEYKIR